MSATSIPASTFQFLNELKKNNERPWFNDHKERYVAANEQFKAFAQAVVDQMSHYDQIETHKVFRIYRDVRFSKNKAPYKTSFSGSLKRATKWLRGGYYFHVEPGSTIVAGGFFAPNSEDLKRIRTEIAADDQPLRRITADPAFVSTFGELYGDGVKTAPKGFSKDHPAIDLIRLKQFLVKRSFTDEQAMTPTFLDEVVHTFRHMRPFFDYMSEVLTTDANGTPLWPKDS